MIFHLLHWGYISVLSLILALNGRSLKNGSFGGKLDNSHINKYIQLVSHLIFPLLVVLEADIHSSSMAMFVTAFTGGEKNSLLR